MANIRQSIKRFLGTTLEDWILAVMMLTAIGLTVFGVRSCEEQRFGQRPHLVEITHSIHAA